MRLHPIKLGLAAGILWGLFMFIVTWISMFSGYAMLWLSQWMDIYPGYDFTILGTVLGFIYGFIDGFISLFLLAWIYNKFLHKNR